MKIFSGEEVLFHITEIKKKVLLYQMNSETFDESIKQMVQWCLQSRCEQAYDQIKKDWLPILFKRLSSIPTDEVELINLIMSQTDYRDYSQRQQDEKIRRESTFTTL